RPIRAVDADPALTSPPAGATAAPLQQLVSVEQLKRLLNPNELPVPRVPRAHAGDLLRDAHSGATVGARRVCVGSIAPELNEADVKAVFDKYGAVGSVQFQRDASGRSKGVAFIEFGSAQQARHALEANGLSLAFNKLTVALAATQDDWRGGDAASARPQPFVGRVPLPLVDVSGEIDEGRSGGLAMNSAQRVMLMQQLSRGETLGSKMRGDVQKLKSCGEATRSIVLSNMFDASNEEAGFEKELLEEVRDECVRKYGKVVHLHVETESHGIVYVRFSRVEEAVKARNDLSGRWFGGKKIVAAFVKDADYSARFSQAE
ncbi:unnamed protein product, partial [Agarophyton chilense]